eukprot:10955479-Heterocapsa_arctica.AAC.1
MTRGAATVAKIKRTLGSLPEALWPRNCAYCKEREVVAFFEKYDFKFTELDVCMYGLVAKHGPNR